MAKKDKVEEQRKPAEPEGAAVLGSEPAATTADATGDAAVAVNQDNLAPVKGNDDAKPKTRKYALRIKAKVASFRRAGYAFGLEPTDVPFDDLSDAQLEALATEPMLSIERVEIEGGTEE
jgi:hypothetical protein